MSVRSSLLALAVVLSFPARGALLAHHGQAAYNMAEPVTVKGTVTDFQFVNPHCIVNFDVKGEKGEIEKWQGELTSPNRLLRQGWTAHSLKAGDEIALTGWRAKTGANSLWISKTIANGQELKTGAAT